jgi:uncharacterized protein (DUF362 family)
VSERLSRRAFLQGVGAAAVAAGLPRPASARAPAKNPTAPVAIARCRSYDNDAVFSELRAMTDRLGGLGKLASGKTVTVKVNLTGNPTQKALDLPANRTYQTHPSLVLALATLLDRAGARRIRFVDCTYQKGPMEAHLQTAGWDLKALAALKAKVEYEDTRNLGTGTRYTEVKVPWGGSLYPAYLLNHCYVDCDTYVSLAKLKNHLNAGVTLSIKNNFGVTPTAIYGQTEQNENTTANRVATFHLGRQKPPAGVPQELDVTTPRRATYRVPRHTIDSLGIRPIDLAIIDGVETVSGGEGPWAKLSRQAAGVLLAGRNPVCTDAVATAVMGYDPAAKAGTGPFPGDNHLAMGSELGLGTIDLKEIEVVGLPLKEATHPFRWEPAARNN